jgi:hypothetical protein
MQTLLCHTLMVDTDRLNGSSCRHKSLFNGIFPWKLS